MSTEARGPFPIIPLAPVEEQWVDWLTNAVCEVDPTAVRDKVRAMTVREFTVPGPRRPVDDSGFERPDADMGRSQDDDEQGDRAADREWAARWGR